jgi:hypothetical protein
MWPEAMEEKQCPPLPLRPAQGEGPSSGRAIHSQVRGLGNFPRGQQIFPSSDEILWTDRGGTTRQPIPLPEAQPAGGPAPVPAQGEEDEGMKISVTVSVVMSHNGLLIAIADVLPTCRAYHGMIAQKNVKIKIPDSLKKKLSKEFLPYYIKEGKP